MMVLSKYSFDLIKQCEVQQNLPCCIPGKWGGQLSEGNPAAVMSEKRQCRYRGYNYRSLAATSGEIGAEGPRYI